MPLSFSPVFADAAAAPAAAPATPAPAPAPAPAAPAPVAAPAAPAPVVSPAAAPQAIEGVAPPAPNAQRPQPSFTDGIVQFLPFIVLIAAFYFLLIRPQRQREKEIRKRQSELKAGDNVLTSAGIYGKVVSIAADKVTLQIGDGVRVVFQRQAIVGFSNSENSQDGAK